MLDALSVLKAIADHGAVMGLLDGGPCEIEHVAQHVTDGPDVRLDKCPCDRDQVTTDVNTDLGEGQYLCSDRHTLGDLVRDVLAANQ